MKQDRDRERAFAQISELGFDVNRCLSDTQCLGLYQARSHSWPENGIVKLRNAINVLCRRYDCGITAGNQVEVIKFNAEWADPAFIKKCGSLLPNIRLKGRRIVKDLDFD